MLKYYNKSHYLHLGSHKRGSTVARKNVDIFISYRFIKIGVCSIFRVK